MHTVSSPRETPPSAEKNVTTIRIAMNGVTGRMGATQHLARSIVAIRDGGGVFVSDGHVIVPEPILVGRNPSKLERLAEAHGGLAWTTDLDECLDDDTIAIYFDAQTTERRYDAVLAAINARKHVYCEKPVAASSADALALAEAARHAGVKHGVVQDKLWLPGIARLKAILDQGYFGRVLAMRGEFGYWVFTGEDGAPQRPSWNYRSEDGGGIMLDMLCHWQYLIHHLAGPVRSIYCHGATHVPHRLDEAGQPYACTADDAAYATIVAGDGIVCQFNSSWATRVYRDDLFTLHVDGTDGSAVATLRDVRLQPAAATPRPTWNPDGDDLNEYRAQWLPAPASETPRNAFRTQWEQFLRHVALDEAFPWTLERGALGVQLAELGVRSWHEGRRIDVPQS